jgi:CubicO group peptidase (beta-lactamase class C family)
MKYLFPLIALLFVLCNLEKVLFEKKLSSVAWNINNLIVDQKGLVLSTLRTSDIDFEQINYALSSLDVFVRAESIVVPFTSHLENYVQRFLELPHFAGKGKIHLSQTTLRFADPVEAGFDPVKLAKLDSIVNYWIADSAFPAAQLLVAKDGKIVFDKAFGTYCYSPTSRKINLNTMFDMASLTKVCATTLAAMKLYDEGKLDIDAPVAKYLPKFAQKGKEKVKVRDLLMHDSGLPPDPPMHLWHTSVISQSQLDTLRKHPRWFVEADSFGGNFDKAHEAMWDSLYATPLQYPTGTKMVYSDINFLILGKIVEKLTGTSLAKFVEENFYLPLGMIHTMFTPPESLENECAPTEYDSASGSLLRGVVHDENARSLGGTAGHAGLFSTANDIAIYIQMLLNRGVYDGRRYLSDSTIALWTRKQSGLSTRGLGWDTKAPAPLYSSAGHYFSSNSFGHTGFTGTSVWVDPERNLFVVLLTNRVCPTRTNDKILEARPDIHDAVIEALKNAIK